MVALYYLVLRDLPMLDRTPTMLKEKMEEFGVASPLGFAGFAIFITFFHSLLEEYYWRWFVFGWLRKHASLAVALTISSLGFMAHHVIVLSVYFPGQFWTAVVPFSLCVAGGGVAWAWLYERSGSIYSPWLSHLLVDAGLFAIGYDLFFVRGVV
jgi:membrane protease YdiL (CAAX protease family)